jgi:hypothetical protein
MQTAVKILVLLALFVCQEAAEKNGNGEDLGVPK